MSAAAPGPRLVRPRTLAPVSRVPVATGNDEADPPNVTGVTLATLIEKLGTFRFSLVVSQAARQINEQNMEVYGAMRREAEKTYTQLRRQFEKRDDAPPARARRPPPDEVQPPRAERVRPRRASPPAPPSPVRQLRVVDGSRSPSRQPPRSVPASPKRQLRVVDDSGQDDLDDETTEEDASDRRGINVVRKADVVSLEDEKRARRMAEAERRARYERRFGQGRIPSQTPNEDFADSIRRQAERLKRMRAERSEGLLHFRVEDALFVDVGWAQPERFIAARAREPGGPPADNDADDSVAERRRVALGDELAQADQLLRRLEHLTYEMNERQAEMDRDKTVPAARLLETLRQLDRQFVGLNTFKDNLASFVLAIIMNPRVRRRQHLGTVLYGPPGTGKTAVSAVLMRVMSAIGVLPEREPLLAVLSRESFVAPFAGQTAIKTRAVVIASLGSAAVIDEAYALNVPSGEGDNDGIEVINTLVKALSDYEGRVMFVLAGYRDDIERNLFTPNAGMRSRFPYQYSLPAYRGAELYALFERELTERFEATERPQFSSRARPVEDSTLSKIYTTLVDIEPLAVFSNSNARGIKQLVQTCIQLMAEAAFRGESDPMLSDDMFIDALRRYVYTQHGLVLRFE